MEKICTHVAILKTGNLVTTGLVEDVLSNEDLVELGAANLEELASIIREISNTVIIDEKTRTLQITLGKGTANLESINRFCFEKGIILNHMLLRKKRLEARFFELTNN